MANPPFNVDGVKLEAVSTHPLFATYGLPVSTAKSGKKSDTFSNANYLWISLFATALNPQGRAGFVMANSASDARGGEAEVRQRMIEAGLVDVMITLASNFFYTVTLPVTLWFFDRAKTDAAHPRHDQTLFIDARKIFHQVTRAHREFTQSQLLNLAAIVWLYRGETDKFHALRQCYEQARDKWHAGAVTNEETGKIYVGLEAQRTAFAAALQSLAQATREWFAALTNPSLLPDATPKFDEAQLTAWLAQLHTLEMATAANLPDKAAINEQYKTAEAVVTFAEKTLRPDKDKTFTKANLKGLLRRVGEAQTDVLFVLERIAYFAAQLAWLDTNFPDGKWRDVEGLCKIASRADIAEQQYSLNPGRYVGVSVEDDGMTADEFQDFMQTRAATLATLHHEADELQRLIADDVQTLFVEAKAEAV